MFTGVLAKIYHFTFIFHFTAYKLDYSLCVYFHSVGNFQPLVHHLMKDDFLQMEYFLIFWHIAKKKKTTNYSPVLALYTICI